MPNSQLASAVYWCLIQSHIYSSALSSIIYLSNSSHCFLIWSHFQDHWIIISSSLTSVYLLTTLTNPTLPHLEYHFSYPWHQTRVLWSHDTRQSFSCASHNKFRRAASQNLILNSPFTSSLDMKGPPVKPLHDWCCNSQEYQKAWDFWNRSYGALMKSKGWEKLFFTCLTTGNNFVSPCPHFIAFKSIF